MSIKIVPHGQDKKDLVELFNRRMREAGSPWGFYVDPEPVWIPKRQGQKVWRELYLAIENEEACVGGYALKPQQWRIRGEIHTVTDWQGPFSLGAIDNRYAAMGLRMVRDMLKKQPLLYSWGHGGNEEPIVQMLRKMGWLLHPTPFLFRVCRPKNFLRKNAYLRQDPKRALAQDVLAFSGLGTIGMHALHKALRVKSLKPRFGVTSEVVSEFGPWADELWERVKDDYAAIAVRDADTMNALVPDEHVTTEWPEPTRLRVRRDGRDIGWAVVVERQKEGDERFGDMRVGLVADYLADPADAAPVVHAAFAHLREVGVDMVMANQAHPGWVAGFEEAGFLQVEDRRIFCASPALEKLLQPWEETREGLFLSNMDGHGPML
ncbi:MAG TPA: hypothetical protein RMH99_24635 [Sandaracinaceae bacterium LLY-WYZ-13_1]|nr:hypothetical protein [Sandaracinaceae bacterium LLY-WYZ-13_1]